MPHNTAEQLRLAVTPQDRQAAQRLRYKVFVEELGGSGDLIDHANRFESDRFDPYCDQLILVDPMRDPGLLDHVIGVYRLMRGDQAEAAGGFYSEAEYDLSRLKASGRRLLELGRSCLAPEARGGTAMFQLWQGLAEYVVKHEIEVLFGVASFHGTDIEALKQPLSYLHHAHLCDEALRPRAQGYRPMDLLAPEEIDRAAAMKATPALIKAYLRLGGTVGDGAYIDHDFNTVDVCLVMDTQRMSAKHRDLYAKARAV
ncbi:MAG: GNAT family N-acyltransferase [Pseudomonadota bacterium]